MLSRAACHSAATVLGGSAETRTPAHRDRLRALPRATPDSLTVAVCMAVYTGCYSAGTRRRNFRGGRHTRW